MKVWCNLTAEQASLYQATVTDMLSRIEEAERRHQPPRPGAGHHGQAQAGVQPPGSPARRRLPAVRPVRQAGPARGDLRRDRGRGRQGAVLHPVRRVRPDAAAAVGHFLADCRNDEQLLAGRTAQRGAEVKLPPITVERRPRRRPRRVQRPRRAATRTSCSRWSSGWFPTATRRPTCVQEAFFSAYRNLAGFRGGSVKSWLNRIAVNAAMDIQRARKRRPVQPYPELEDESWQPPAGEDADPVTTALTTERHRAPERGPGHDHRRPAGRDRPVRHRGLRLRRDRRHDRASRSAP